jgi:hypothetical protein
MLEVMTQDCVWGAGRRCIWLQGDAHSMGDSNPSSTFGYGPSSSAGAASPIFTRESSQDRISPELKQRFDGVLIANEG